jgi:uncharacterized lipoprotein YmbA
MRNIFFDRLASCIVGVLVVVLSGCASSTPSRFYQLNPVISRTVVAQDVPNQDSVIVSIGPLRIPDYLDRPQIMTRSGKNELKLSEFDRWAGSLENDVIRVLVENISTLLPPDRFFVTRWTPLMESQLPPSYRVEVLIERFEGTPGGSVLLKVQWVVFGQDKRLLVKKESNISEQVNGSSYGELVETMSRALQRLSRDIADALTSKSGTGAV